MSQKKREGFILGAILLSASGMIVKLIGVLFKIPLASLVGTGAIGYYSKAYEVYNFLLSLATSGLPIGIATMVSRSLALGKDKDIKNLIRSVLIIFSSVGAFLAILGLVFSDWISAELLSSEKTYYCVVCIMPAIFFMAVVSVFRGFFQGYNNMAPTALSNLIEAFVKLGFGYGIALWMSANGYENYKVVGGAIFGVMLGTFFSCLFLVLRYVFRGAEYRPSLKNLADDKPTPIKKLLAMFFKISLPIILSSITVHLMSLIDVAIVSKILDGMYGTDRADLLWGAYSGLASTIYNLPSYLIITIGISLVPSISGAYSSGNKEKLVSTADKAFRYSSILAFACAFGLAAVSKGALNLFYMGNEGLSEAVPLLSVLSISLVAVGLTNVTNYMLQATGKAYLTVITVGVGAVLKTVLNYVLVSNFGIIGAPVATNIVYPVMLLINLVFIKKNMGITPKVKDVFFKPFACGICCFIIAFLCSFVFDKLLPARIAVIPAILVAAIVYIALLFLLKLVTIAEIKQLLRKNK